MFRGTRVPVHMLAEQVPSRVRAHALPEGKCDVKRRRSAQGNRRTSAVAAALVQETRNSGTDRVGRGLRWQASHTACCQIPERALAMLLKAVLISVPRFVTATTQITAIRPTSLPYSTKAAPSSSGRNRLIKLPMRTIHCYLRRRLNRLAQASDPINHNRRDGHRLKKIFADVLF